MSAGNNDAAAIAAAKAVTDAAAKAASDAAANASRKWFEQDSIKEQMTSEMIGHIQNRGLGDKDAATVAAAMIKAHTEAEKKLGAPADQLVRMPKDAADEAGHKELRKRLGVPENKSEYDFSAIKKADGTPDEKLIETLRNVASSAHLTKDAAVVVAAEVKKVFDEKAAADAAEYKIKVDTERADLQKDWGAQFEANKFVAGQAAAKLGISPEVVATLEKQVGYKATMKAFHAIGVKTGEDKFIRGDSPANGASMSLDQAKARKTELMGDAVWRKKYDDGDTVARHEMLGLNTLIAAGDTTP